MKNYFPKCHSRTSANITRAALGRLAHIENEPVALIANEGAAIQPGTVYLANESVVHPAILRRAADQLRHRLARPE